MNTQQDFEELLRLLEEQKVEYLIVGGYAVAFHGFPRFTNDIDILYHRALENIINLQKALVQFGFTAQELPIEVFKSKLNVITLGIDAVRVDMVNQIDGVDFKEAWDNKVRGAYGKVAVNFIGRAELIKNKKSTSRLQDKADVEKLTEK
jgi:hypothetical protein